jgi:tetratricopeptide (TPR) repeat protein
MRSLTLRSLGILAFLSCFSLTIGFEPSLWAAKAGSKKKVSAAKMKGEKKKKSAKDDAQKEPDDTFYDNVWRQFEVGSAPEKKDAIAQFKARLKIDPNDGVAHYYLGLMLMQEGKNKPAEEHLRAALVIYPDSADVKAKLAELMGGTRKGSDEATAMYEQLLAENPHHAEALSYLGLKALAEEQAEQAIDLLSRAHVANPENHETIRGLGIAMHNVRRFAEAVDSLKKALVFDDTDAEVHFLLGKCYEQTNKAVEAAAAFERAKALGRKETNIAGLIGYDLARALRDQGKFEAAIAEYQKAIKTATEPALGWFEIGNIHNSLHDSDKAIDAYKKTYNTDPKQSEAAFLVGKLLRDQNKLEEAIGALELIKSKRDLWGDKAKAEIDEIKAQITGNERDRLMDLASDESETVREKALLQLLEMDKKDEFALAGMRDLCTTRGDLDQAKAYMNAMKKAGYISQSDYQAEVIRIQDRQESGDDLAVWENRRDDFIGKGDWTNAAKMQNKLLQYAIQQREYWIHYIPKGKNIKEKEAMRKKMISDTRYRIKSIKQDLKDYNRKKRGD